ncbi:disulfide oxidoreductase [Bacillus sp. RO1]|uniref:disulfide oxidoreductase n=1 Tax=Bacillus sp. RO1 TaxID=2722703 RepID=UPI0014566EB1|nr:disulfide bond formation protein B [Bacillus sp. RO1]
MDYSKKIENLLLASAIIALVASLGSLYFSEVLLYIPCELCWYQRILMYPLVILLGIAAVKKDAGIATYVLPLSIIGGTISIYHYLIQKVAFFSENSVSCGVVPCTGQYINWLGFITIPFLALIGFTSITVILFYVKKLSKKAGN